MQRLTARLIDWRVDWRDKIFGACLISKGWIRTLHSYLMAVDD